MKTKSLKPLLIALSLCISAQQNASAQQNEKMEKEKYRPQFHFTPQSHWMNDPNGMVYHNGVYHLFFQYHPGGTTWGPMHWGHATSKDLYQWQEKPIALYPDSLGTIFSGSAVIDEHNTAGFGKNAMVAIFTHHNQKIEEAKTGLHQYQSLAYSNDEGQTWTKYKGNPVLPNPGITDFRDPKVMWYESGKKWIMTLATKDRITFYSSPDLKKWQKESEFGAERGAHGGVWECPDLFPLTLNGKTVWVLLVSINPGGPNGGSATQYFTGSFDGNKFTADSDKLKWIDYGTDNYAGVTWSNTGARKIFLGWMNNWQYANQVPTKSWRGATTLPRELSLSKENGEVVLRSTPVKEFIAHLKPVYQSTSTALAKTLDLSKSIASLKGKMVIELSAPKKDLQITLANKKGEQLLVGYELKGNRYYIDRTGAGESRFEKGFAGRHYGPRISGAASIELKLVLDVASAELFADSGSTVLTDVFFPGESWSILKVDNTGRGLEKIRISAIVK